MVQETNGRAQEEKCDPRGGTTIGIEEKETDKKRFS